MSNPISLQSLTQKAIDTNNKVFDFLLEKDDFNNSHSFYDGIREDIYSWEQYLLEVCYLEGKDPLVNLTTYIEAIEFAESQRVAFGICDEIEGKGIGQDDIEKHLAGYIAGMEEVWEDLQEFYNPVEDDEFWEFDN